MDIKLDYARKLAVSRNIIRDPEDLQISKLKNKRFSVKFNGKTINFGQWPHTGRGTFIDHSDVKLRDAWRKRHSKILTSDGFPAYIIMGTPSYYSWNILW